MAICISFTLPLTLLAQPTSTYDLLRQHRQEVLKLDREVTYLKNLKYIHEDEIRYLKQELKKLTVAINTILQSRAEVKDNQLLKVEEVRLASILRDFREVIEELKKLEDKKYTVQEMIIQRQAAQIKRLEAELRRAHQQLDKLSKDKDP